MLVGSLLVSLLPACGILSVDQDGAPDREMDWDNIPDPTPRIAPLSKTGNPTSYVVDGKRYYVKSNAADYSETGKASWYGTKFHGNLTSSGEPYDMFKMTAAHKSLPLPSYVSVTNLENQKQIIVKVNDRGPFVEGRIIDLSYAAAQKLGIVDNGTADVQVKMLATPDTRRITNNGYGDLDLSGTKKFFVQLGAFSEMHNAEKFRNQLASQSIEPTLIKSYSDIDGDLHKVQVGPLSSVEDLQSMESRLMELGYTQVYIITE